jgi:signal transduction histidine kinase
VDLLRKPHTEEEEQQYLEVLSRQSGRMKRLIEDLIDLSKATTGNIQVNTTRLDAAEAVQQALGEFSDKMEAVNLTPVFRHSEDSVWVQADGRLMWRVLSNLLSNAVKYAMPGTRLYLDLARNGNQVLIAMKNVSREELKVNAEELLERFVQGDTSRSTEGSGLGLNIAQSLMELQGGTLQIQMDGDLFKVVLTFCAAE